MTKSFHWKTILRFCTISLVFLLSCTAIYFAFFEKYPSYQTNKPIFNSYASAAVSIYEYGGSKALENWLHDLERHRNTRMYILNKNGKDVLGREIPRFIRAAIAERNTIKHSLPPHFMGATKEREQDHLIFAHVVSTNGHSYFVITDIPRINKSRTHQINSQQYLGFGFLIALLLGGTISVWLTWYLTRPISKLRLATQEWSSGNLAARVGADLGKRQDEVAVLARDLDKMAEKLHDLITHQQRLFTDISHELRTPLARLQIALGLARQRTGDLAKTEFDRIELEAERLNEMIGQVLSLVRLGTATYAEDKEETDIVEMLSIIIANAEFENRAAEKTAHLQSHNSIPTAIVNSQLIYSALENIIRNAFRYNPARQPIAIHVQHIDDSLQITIRDHGPGIPSDMQDKIFEPFFRVAAARERDTGGYGLGLAIAKRAVEIHGGIITAVNAAEGGLLITITLPLGSR